MNAKRKVEVNKVGMAINYMRMGKINLAISRADFSAENEGEMISEMVAKEGYSYTQEDGFGS